MKKNTSAILLFFTLFLFSSNITTAQSSDWPQVGAQLFIEPGQSKEEIDNWFALLEKSKLTVCRVNLNEEDMNQFNGTWDYSLYDHVFQSAEKHHVKIFATLFPKFPNYSEWDIKLPVSDQQMAALSLYIQTVVKRYQNSPALYAWILQNEPGVADNKAPDNAFARMKYEEWKKQQPLPVYNNAYRKGDFSYYQFTRDHDTWYLNWIASEIRKYDQQHPTHVNNHKIFENLPQYDFPKWRKFLSSLGASMHPSWHFSYFNRNEYTLALAANCDIIKSGAGPLPFWVTELQGGNNLYSAYNPFCPTKEEIAQWLWTSIGSGAQGVIFWTLNPRATGYEAGEWAMVNAQNQPSDRLIAASQVSKVIQENKPLFAEAKPVESTISILFNQESAWVEKSLEMRDPSVNRYFEGRMPGAAMKSCLTWYKALMELGIPCHFSEMDDYDWNTDTRGKVVIIANQASVPSRHWKNLEAFVNNGGKLIATGLTAFFDENHHAVMDSKFPLQKLFGANLKEFKMVADTFALQLKNPSIKLPAHLWRGTLQNNSAQSIGKFEDEDIAVRNRFGAGEVLWIPSLIELGAWHRHHQPFTQLVKSEFQNIIATLPITFENQYENMVLRVIKSGNRYISTLVNKSPAPIVVKFRLKQSYKPLIFFKDNKAELIDNKTLKIYPEETVVIKWE